MMLYRPQGLLGTKELTSFFKKSKNDKGGPKDGNQQTVA
jgi:branched-chain amino acid transport system permease protein